MKKKTGGAEGRERDQPIFSLWKRAGSECTGERESGREGERENTGA